MLLVEQGCSQDICKLGAHHYGVLHKPGYTYSKEVIIGHQLTLSNSKEIAIRILVFIHIFL